MARLAACALLTGLFARVSSLSLMFINPPPFDWPDDFSGSPKYKEGDTVNVSWMPNEDGGRLSWTLSQRGEMDPTIGSAEFLMQNAASATSYSWVVGTGKKSYKVESVLSQHFPR
ncbi:uncharacterized protein ALTATR162_LOCUS2798 [Alternaria atra]|uniref:Uncharacterized protein n=1 Tax=Alternaria atra TaxID=119953 RepID=A0A8J2HVX8_9PLEO|nr:uncharacterized protein ALTATR162_LOCUS2798 [Alternaria atra]CAG5152509.1 unnamed protein product [Alternaria atra]